MDGVCRVSKCVRERESEKRDGPVKVALWARPERRESCAANNGHQGCVRCEGRKERWEEEEELEILNLSNLSN